MFCRKPYCEGAPQIRNAFQPYVSVMKRYDPFYKGKAKAAALFFVRSISLIKLVKYVFLHFRCHADTGIMKSYGEPVLVHSGDDIDFSSRRGEFFRQSER